MKKTVYIHVGLPKTATTSVQHLAHRNRQTLWWRGLSYPRLPGPKIAHHAIGWSLRGQQHRFPQDCPTDADTILAKTAAAVRRSLPRRILISSETLCELRPDMIARLLDTLAGAGAAVRAIAVVRRPDRLCLSHYNQNVKSAKSEFTLDFAPGIKALAARGLLDFDRRLGPWVEALGPERVRLLLFEDGDPVAAVYADAGLPERRLPAAATTRNTAVPAMLCAILALAKRRGLPPETLRTLQHVGREVFADQPHHCLSRAEAEAIFAAVREDHERFFDRLGRPNPYRAEALDLPDGPAPTRPDAARAEAELDALLQRIAAPAVA